MVTVIITYVTNYRFTLYSFAYWTFCYKIDFRTIGEASFMYSTINLLQKMLTTYLLPIRTQAFTYLDFFYSIC